MGHEAKWEYFRVMYERYRKAEAKRRRGLLDEFCLTAGYNRKYAIRLLNGPPPGQQRVRQPRGRKPRYGKQVVSILMAVWEAAGYPWSVRLKALLPGWLPWIRKRYRLNQETEKQLLAISARQMDRRPLTLRDQQEREFAGRCVVIAEGGLAAVLPEALPPGSVVPLQLPIPTHPTVLAVWAVVRNQLGLRHGFEFVSLADSELAAIRQFCSGLMIQPEPAVDSQGQVATESR